MNMLQQHYLFNDQARRFSGLLIVVGLHLGIITALMIGLQPKNNAPTLGDIIIKTVEEPQDPVDVPPPPRIDYVSPAIEVPSPTPWEFALNTPASGHTITQAKAEPPPAVQKAPPTPANSPKKGLSAPSYPSESKKLGEEGAVGLALYLNEEGKVQDARVETSSGFLRLDAAAVKHAIRSWKFEPCTEDGKPVACLHKIRFRFQLNDV